MCLCVVPEWGYVHMHVGVHKDQTRTLSPLKLATTLKIRLWVAVRKKMWVLKIKLIYSRRAKKKKAFLTAKLSFQTLMWLFLMESYLLLFFISKSSDVTQVTIQATPFLDQTLLKGLRKCKDKKCQPLN